MSIQLRNYDNIFVLSFLLKISEKTADLTFISIFVEIIFKLSYAVNIINFKSQES